MQNCEDMKKTLFIIISALLALPPAMAQNNNDVKVPTPVVPTPVVPDTAATPQAPAAVPPAATQSPAAPQPVQPKFGYLDYRAVFEAMPGYAEAQKSLAEIKAKYDTETAHNEENFKRMYLEFLQGQKDFPQTIMLKRQKELQAAMESGIQFRNQVSEMLTKAQEELEKPLLAKLDSAISLVGQEKGFDMIINTGEKGFPFINKVTGEDVTELVRQKIAAIKP